MRSSKACYVLFLRTFLLLVLLSLLFACKKKEEAPASVGDSRSSAASVAAGGKGKELAAEGVPAAASPQTTQRKVIMSHALSMEVKSFAATLQSLTALAEANGGYIYQSTRSSLDKKSYSGTIGIRVPVGKSGSVLGAIRNLGEVENERSTAQDITDDYVDMEARLKNAQASEARLKEMYQRAGTVEDVLEVEKELTRVRGDIEAFQAKKRNWDLQVAMVTIEVNLHEPAAALPTGHSFWEPIRTAFSSSLEVFATSVRALIIFTSAAIPWLLALVPAYYLLRLINRWRERSKAVLEESRTGQS